MSSPSIFVNDGWTLVGKWSAIPGLYPAGSFRYRPATNAVRFEVQSVLTPAELEATQYRVVARRLVDVSVEGDGEPIRLREEQVKTLHPGIFQVMFNHVMGFSGPSVEQAEGNSEGA